MRQELENELRQVMYRAATPGGNQSITFSPAALELLGEADARFSKHRLTARLSVAAYKVAALLTMADGEWAVPPLKAGAAINIVQRWADGAMRLRAHLGRPAADYAFMELIAIARESLQQAKGMGVVAGRRVLTRQDAAKVLQLEHRTLNRVRDSLADTGEIVVVRNDEGEEWHCAI